LILYIAFDDTDNLTSPGTGHLLEDFRTLTAEKGWGRSWRISRHQLFVHPDVPYTSHNSAMCFVLETRSERMEEIRMEAVRFLETLASEGSDPGLCILNPEILTEKERLTEFGRRAKREVLTKEEAYETARRCGAVLSEHGGTGGGVIGALAGTALRMEGMDGRFRGQLEGIDEGAHYDAGTILDHDDIEALALLEPGKNPLDAVFIDDPAVTVRIVEKPKTILLKGCAVLLLRKTGDGSFENWTRTELKQF